MVIIAPQPITHCQFKTNLSNDYVYSTGNCSLTKDLNRFADTLEIIKFICKEFWYTLYQKQIDVLSTDHKGVYVLEDSKFRLVAKLSSGPKEVLNAECMKYLVLPCGIIRGALHNLGLNATVKADIVNNIPHIAFRIRIV